MSKWSSKKARLVFRALARIGWGPVPAPAGHKGSHVKLRHNSSSFPDFIWSFHDGDEIGPKMLARIAKHTGLKPEDI
jgi:predicted RNA binding protein YcfA (HicA-like mRNA interferase family)